jgi:hypothetical protein
VSEESGNQQSAADLKWRKNDKKERETEVFLWVTHPGLYDSPLHCSIDTVGAVRDEHGAVQCSDVCCTSLKCLFGTKTRLRVLFGSASLVFDIRIIFCSR